MTATRRVPFFNYPALFESDSDGLLATMTDVMKRGAYIMQKDLEAFEHSLTEFLGVKHAFGVADGTNAITLSLVAAGVEPGDEVIMPSHTYIATARRDAHGRRARRCWPIAGPITCSIQRRRQTGHRPHARDHAGTGERTHLRHGRSAGSSPSARPADRRGRSPGAGLEVRRARRWHVRSGGTISFYPAKVLGCFGDGGGVVTNDDDVAERIFRSGTTAAVATARSRAGGSTAGSTTSRPRS